MHREQWMIDEFSMHRTRKRKSERRAGENDAGIFRCELLHGRAPHNLPSVLFLVLTRGFLEVGELHVADRKEIEELRTYRYLSK